MNRPLLTNGQWSAEHFDAHVIALTLDQLYVEAPTSTHPFVARMQPVNPVELVEHILHQAEKQIATPEAQRASD